MDEVNFDIKPATDHDVHRQIPSALFIGRETDLKEVSALVSKTMGSSMPFTGMFGEPGSGKASLAQELCGRLMKDGKVKDVFWVDATDMKSTMEGLVHIASRVGILQGNVNPLSESVWKSLQARQTPWLLFVEDVSIQQFKNWVRFCPGKYGAVLFTVSSWKLSDLDDSTKNDISNPIRSSLEINSYTLEPMTRSDALDLFFSLLPHKRWERTPESEKYATEILDKLEYHASTIKKEARSIFLSGIFNFAPLAHKYEKYSINTMAMQAQRISLCDTLRSSLRKAHVDEQGALQFLYFLSFFDCSSLSMQLVYTAFACKDGTDYQLPWGSVCLEVDGGWDSMKCRKLIKELSMVSLLQLESDECDLFSMHPAVQNWLQCEIQSHDRAILATLAVETTELMIKRELGSRPHVYSTWHHLHASLLTGFSHPYISPNILRAFVDEFVRNNNIELAKEVMELICKLCP